MTAVRLFASLREAAGAGRVDSDAATVVELLAELRARFGPEFSRRLSVAAVLVDGDPVARDSDRELHDATEVALLPPVSGGA